MKTTSDDKKIGFIFDLDGTLLDNIDFFLKELPKKVALNYEVEFTKEMEHKMKSIMFEIFGGSPNKGKFLIFQAMMKSAKIFKVPWYKRLKFLKNIKKFYREGIGTVPLIEGVEKTLDFLKERNISIGINTTSSEEEILDRFKNRMEFLERFDGSIVGRDTVPNLKPAPDGIIFLSKRWGIPANKIVMIGDFVVDIKTGKAANSLTIGVLSGFSNKNALEEANADFIFNDINEIPENLDEIIFKIKKRNNT